MINNLKCDACAFQNKCVAKNKLKPFSEDARVDLGVELDFISCNDYQDIDEECQDGESDSDPCPPQLTLVDFEE